VGARRAKVRKVILERTIFRAPGDGGTAAAAKRSRQETARRETDMTVERRRWVRENDRSAFLTKPTGRSRAAVRKDSKAWLEPTRRPHRVTGDVRKRADEVRLSQSKVRQDPTMRSRRGGSCGLATVQASGSV
jgi:hypothetical protein